MGKKSKSHGKDQSVRIKVDAPPPPIINVADSALSAHLDQKHVSISLRYFQKSCECFSEWEKPELKKFSSTLEKIRNYNAAQLMATYSLCSMHKGPPNESRFSIPNDLSRDVPLHEIKVDPSNKLRVHGFFAGPVFFLIWLDRKHACFKFGK